MQTHAHDIVSDLTDSIGHAAELEASIANGTAVASTTSRPLPQLPAYDPASVALARLNQSSAPNFQHLADSPAGDTPNIGAGSLDWRLATPQMASALSQHLCDGEPYDDRRIELMSLLL